MNSKHIMNGHWQKYNTTTGVVTSLESPHSFDLFCHPARASFRKLLYCHKNSTAKLDGVYFGGLTTKKKSFSTPLPNSFGENWTTILIYYSWWYKWKKWCCAGRKDDFSKLRGIFNQISKTWLALKNCSNKRTVWQTCRQNRFDH